MHCGKGKKKTYQILNINFCKKVNIKEVLNFLVHEHLRCAILDWLEWYKQKTLDKRLRFQFWLTGKIWKLLICANK